MKKNMVRIVAALLVAMLALTLIPMGAFAAPSANVFTDYYGKTDVEEALEEGCYDYFDLTPDSYLPGETIKYNKYSQMTILGDELYDFKGFIDNTSKDLSFIKKDMKVDTYPTSFTAQAEWANKWSAVVAAYTPHQHKLSYWYSDGTTHWRECLVCKKYPQYWEQFMYQNWCTDGDEDGICNVCGGDVPYHDITVIESEGGKITLNRDNASHRTKITADVEVEDGYKLKKLHFVKVRDDGSKQEITRYKKNGQFWTRMPTYEMEVSAEFVKTKK